MRPSITFDGITDVTFERKSAPAWAAFYEHLHQSAFLRSGGNTHTHRSSGGTAHRPSKGASTPKLHSHRADQNDWVLYVSSSGLRRNQKQRNPFHLLLGSSKEHRHVKEAQQGCFYSEVAQALRYPKRRRCHVNSIHKVEVGF